MTTSEPASIRSRGAVHGVVSTSTAAIVQGVGQLLVLAILARYVSKTDFGLVTATLVVIGLGRQLAEALVSPVLVQRERLTPRDVGTAATLSWAFGFIAVAALWFGAGGVAKLFSEPGIVPIIQVMALVFLLQSPLCVAEGLVQRDFGYGRLAASEVLSFLLGYTIVGVTLALLGAGVWALVWAYVAQVLVKTVFLLYFRPDALRMRFDPASARQTLRLAGGFGSAKLLNYAALQGDYAVVATAMNAAAVGVYGRAYQIVSMPVMLLGQALERVLFPIYARLQNDRVRAAEHYSHSVAISAILIAPVSVLIAVLAPEIVRLILGPDWQETVVPLQILGASLLFRMGYKLNDPLTKGFGVVYARVWRIAVYAAAVLVGAVIGLPWGLPGVAVGVSVAIAINFFLMAQLALRILGLRWRDYATMHVRGVSLALCMLPLAWGAASVLRLFETAYFAVLIVVVLLVGVCWLVTALVRPELALGPDVQWLSRLIGSAIAPPVVSLSEAPPARAFAVEFLSPAGAGEALHDAVATHLKQNVPLRYARQSTHRCSDALNAFMRTPRLAFYQALILFSALRQEGGHSTRRIASWLALHRQHTGMLPETAVTLSNGGIVSELLLLDRQGDINSIISNLDEFLVTHLPDLLVIPETRQAPEGQQQVIDLLQTLRATHPMQIIRADESASQSDLAALALRIAEAVSEKYKTHSALLIAN